ncbi:ribosomal RNA small subunit methyltransferase A [Spirochaetia bacterium]|nr:ribosomal RNA small subunit methyltransferase A [Spirochaetia bacterium]
MPPLINYDSPVFLKAFLEERELGMRKKFGQNFLVDSKARTMLLDALEIEPGDEVWEVGPGLGAMTAGLLERGAAVKAFEIDAGFIKILKEYYGDNPRFTLVEGDVFKTWREAGAAPGAGLGQCPFFLGNLPYNIAAALLADLIEGQRFFKRMVVTVQREVADRMIAKPGSADYSSFSVLCSSVYTLTPLRIIKGSAFYPVPHVDSRGIRFDLRTDRDPGAYPPLWQPLVRRLFADRRKTIKNNLQGFIGSAFMHHTDKEAALRALESCGIDPQRRAETLSPEEFSALAIVLEEMKKKGIEIT